MSKYQWSSDLVASLHEALAESKRIVILPHTAPDGDAVGSILGWKLILEHACPEAEVTAISPDRIEDYLRWMPHLEELLCFADEPERCLERLAEADLICHLDHNTITRLRHAPLIEAVRASGARRLLIDHHLDPDPDFDYCISLPNASATCELIYQLSLSLGYREAITPEAATLLLTGIITDTGRFMYSHLCPELFETASGLLALGADYAQIIDRLNYHNPEQQLRLQGYVLDRKLELYPELRAAVLTLSQQELQQYGASKGDTEGLVNLPLSIEGIDCSCFIREDRTQIKLSLRSTGDFPVNELAQEAFGGGGHRNAAGAEYQGSIEEAKNIYLCHLQRLVARRRAAQPHD